MVDVPSREPSRLISGDTWEWTREWAADYPSPTWTLTYYFRHASTLEAKTFTGASDGSGGFSIAVPAADTKEYAPGRWSFVARVSSGAVVHTVARGFVEVLPDYADEGADHRTYNERCLDAIEAVREGRASTDQSSYTINDRSVGRMSWDELEEAWTKFRNLVAAERGIKTSRVMVRM